MNYGLDTLMKLGSLAHVDVSLQGMSDRTKTTVKNALMTGIIQSTTGQAATYHAIICDHLQIPTLAFSKKGRYWESLHMKYVPEAAADKLSEWWQADRVMYRLEKPDEWNDYVERAKNYNWYGEITEEPNWTDKLGCKLSRIRIMGTKTLDRFEEIALCFTKDDEYKAKALKAIQLINEGETIHVQQKGLD